MQQFLNPRVLTAFLRQYLSVREEYWQSPIGKLQSIYRDDASIKRADCICINRKFYNEEKLADLEGWASLLYYLGEMGRKPLLLSETLQAIRSYIVAKLLQSDTYKQAFAEYREKLIDETKQIKKRMNMSAYAKESKEDVDKIQTQYHTNLLKLADLGHFRSIFKASREGLFKDLPYPHLKDQSLPLMNKLNENIPFCYHEDFHLFFYEKHIRSRLQITFEDFEKESTKLSDKIELDTKTHPSKSSGFGGWFHYFTHNTENSLTKIQEEEEQSELESQYNKNIS